MVFRNDISSGDVKRLTRGLDYQGFAAEHPEQLAKAIERGIPKTLRGMVWQLM